ncbi:MAG TPA: hypothetical protein V6C88_21275 [Chroococcidiopsis sp.]|jgi:hypothetical protein
MNRKSLEDISLKLVKIVQTRDPDKVRYWVTILERQKDPMVTVNLFILVRRHLQRMDAELDRWFEEIYCENLQPEVRDMWLNFAQLCSLSL